METEERSIEERLADAILGDEDVTSESVPPDAEAEEIPHARRPKSVPRTPVLDLHVGGLGADRP